MAVPRVVFAGGMSASLIVGLLIAVPFASGWEVANSIEALTLTDQPNTTYSVDCKILGNTDGVEIGTYECANGPSSWRVDVDEKWFNRPSLFIEISPVRHTNFQGVQTDNNLAVESRTVTRQRDTYFLDYHVFMFDFRVRTVADARAIPGSCTEVFFVANCVYETETAYRPGSSGECTQAHGCGKGGIPFDGSSFIGFGINPWQGARTPPENTVRFGQWVGIMQAIIEKAETGFDREVPQDAPGFAVAVLAEGAAANMFTLSGNTQRNYVFGTASLDDDIPQFVLVELPYKLQAGADVEVQTGGGLRTVVASNMNIHYVIRMDVLLVTGWQPQLDYIDTNGNNIRDASEFTFIDKNEDNLWTMNVDEAISGTPPVQPAVSAEAPIQPPESPPQTGSQLEGLGPVPDLTLPAPCEFWNLSCFFNTAINFPTVSSIVSLLATIIIIVIIVFVGLTVLGLVRRRGR